MRRKLRIRLGGFIKKVQSKIVGEATRLWRQELQQKHDSVEEKELNNSDSAEIKQT